MKFYLPTIALLATCIACTNNTPNENYVPLGDVLTKSSASGGTQTGSTESSSQGSTGKINPAHGQPGHRCDLPEGAALPDNTPVTPPTSATPAQAQPPVTNVTSTPASTPNEIKVTPAPVTASKAGGLNPEHGKPGHRCDIAVGSPLNSKPTTPTTAATTQPPAVVPTPAKTTTAPGMNPAHGEPGHRCDIAVGSPLKSADNKAAKDDAPQAVKLREKDSSKN